MKLDHLAVLAFEGPDARTFLQAQVTADIDRLAPGSPVFACVCNPKGRVLGLLLLGDGGEECVWAICAAELADGLAAHLERFILRSKVRIGRRPDLSVLGLSGDEAPETAVAVLTHAVGGYAIVTASGFGPARPDQARDWLADEMLRGVHWLDAATSEAFLPQMLGLQSIGALSFRKGCYPGQEVIARTRHLGRLKRHPLLCLVDGEVRADAMDETLLRDTSDEASAVVVKAIAQNDGKTLMMLVARSPEGFSPRALSWGGTDYAISRSASGSGTATGTPSR